ncbi:MAG: lysophospholipid acyltransferase family protein [bacterium]
MGLVLWRKNWLYKIIKIIGHICFSLFYNLKIEGQEKIPAQGPAIILPKHQFWTDIPLIGLSIPKSLSYIAKKELFVYPLVRHFLMALGGIPLDRMKPIKSLNSFRYIEKLLQAKEFIVLFPEGTYYPYVMGQGKHGLIQHLLYFQEKMGENGFNKIPFIPMGLKYGKNGWPRKVEIKIGEPIYAPAETESKEFTKRITREIARLSGIPES